MVRFTSKATPDLIEFTKERLEQAGIIVVTREECNAGGVILGLTTTQEELEMEAESVKLVKPITSPMTGFGEEEGIMEYFTVDTREDFLGYPDSDFFDDKDSDRDEYDSLGLFTASDQVMLIWDMLGSMTVLAPGTISSNLSRKLIDMKCSGFHHSRLRRTASGGDVSDELQKKCLGLLLQENDLIDLISPVHITHIRRKLLKETMKLTTGPPIRPMRDYYGDEVAFFFAWMNQFTRWLVIPGIFGLVIYLLRMHTGDTVDTCRFVPFHGIIMFIWGILFLRYWEREEKRLAYEWGNFSSVGYARKVFNARPGFQGELRVSPVTGAPEKYYPIYKRRLKYIGSALITMVLLAGAFLIMILSLNLQGYVRPRDDRERWQSDHEHPFYYPFFATLAEEGNLFDAASYWRCYIPVVLHVAVVMSMNMCYRHIAEALTEWENHETEVAHENSLILKRFLFEAFDAYIILFYLAFFEKDVGKLRSELVSLFNVDTFRRLLVECILPMVLQWQSKRSEKKAYGERKKMDISTNDDGDDGTIYKPLNKQVMKDPYEEFDDYLEMVIELGYITLFASAYPLAPFLAIFANFVEIRTDMLKLTKVCLRPRSIRTDNIGTWKMLMSAIIWGSALTNCLIFGFSSKQLHSWLPGFFYIDDYGQHKMVQGRGWIIIFLIFGIERILIFLALFINQVINTVPPDVKIKEERRQFIRLQLTQKLRVRETKSKSSLKASASAISALMGSQKRTTGIGS